MTYKLENSLVSICCLTFNHEIYLKQCLDGFISQKTNFKYEIIIHDDASTDGTKEIIEEYTSQYPGLIVAIFQKENQYSKGIKPIFNYVFPRAQGKYIALCEGDDYWTDPYKLQKQVDFLEANEEYAVCAHDTLVKYENQDKQEILFSNFPAHPFKNEKRNIYTFKDALTAMLFHTSSIVMKNPKINAQLFNKYFANVFYGDHILMLIGASMGKLYVFDEIMSVYRINSGGVTTNPKVFSNMHNWLESKILLHSKLKEWFKPNFQDEFNSQILYYQNQLDDLMKNKTKMNRKKKLRSMINIKSHIFKLAKLVFKNK